ncbi:LD-carboxypeptidase [Solibacillus sp. A46]|uniref:LD-carboxypeptidase n=1 Tax=Solibacillus faecavium TaxID=2762221 RepID=A0ABR8XW24_9BACL|nr:LD-carboxypeptidase [Solibacillus faecavium]MBD8036139.1 LD-carboxypeptidase [Solibacillus faecavium]
MRQKPKRLKKGDTVGIISPSGPYRDGQLEKALPFLESLGLNYKLGENCDKRWGYLAGSDEERLSDLHTMFSDPDIAGIICARGGYGAARITDKIDFELLNNNPKILWGYSDITFLHTAIGQKNNIVTFHGPMLASDVAGEDFAPLSAKMFEQLFEPTELVYEESISQLHILSEGIATAEIVGGNLSLLTNSLGTAFEIDTTGKLLFIEDIGEEPYRVDCMLNQLRHAKKLDHLAGVVIGDFADAASTGDKPTLTLDEVFDDYFYRKPYPVMKGFKIGHCQPHFAIPLGVEATLNTKEKTLRIMPGVQ